MNYTKYMVLIYMICLNLNCGNNLGTDMCLHNPFKHFILVK